jgi:hypothetical protein
MSIPIHSHTALSRTWPLTAQSRSSALGKTVVAIGFIHGIDEHDLGLPLRLLLMRGMSL